MGVEGRSCQARGAQPWADNEYTAEASIGIVQDDEANADNNGLAEITESKSEIKARYRALKALDTGVEFGEREWGHRNADDTDREEKVGAGCYC